MKLYWGPHTCAIGTHVLLEEVGAPYEAQQIDVQGGDTEKDWFRAINPKGKVPTLVLDDGRVLTEFGAIGDWLAATHPSLGLVPEGADEAYRARAVTDYAVGTIHGQGFGRLFLPEKFEPQGVLHQGLKIGQGSVKQQGLTMIGQGFDILERELEGRQFVAGDRFGVADAALFYVTRWAAQEDITLPPNLAAHLQRMKARGAVQRVMAVWGEK